MQIGNRRKSRAINYSKTLLKRRVLLLLIARLEHHVLLMRVMEVLLLLLYIVLLVVGRVDRRTGQADALGGVGTAVAVAVSLVGLTAASLLITLTALQRKGIRLWPNFSNFISRHKNLAFCGSI